MESVSHGNKNFIPDWTFAGSSLADTEQFGSAKWTVQNGDVIGTPSSPEGGWLLFKNALQDVQMAASFQCAAGCQAGLVLRLEKTAKHYACCTFRGYMSALDSATGRQIWKT